MDAPKSSSMSLVKNFWVAQRFMTKKYCHITIMDVGSRDTANEKKQKEEN
jgi:hypothetical protein